MFLDTSFGRINRTKSWNRVKEKFPRPDSNHGKRVRVKVESMMCEEGTERIGKFLSQ